MYSTSREEKKQKELEKKQMIIVQCSEIINEMPQEVKDILTSRMGNLEITAQDSFINYFKNAVPRYDVETFKIKFVEVFNNIGERVVSRTVQQKKKNDSMANEKFWREFEILFKDVPGSYNRRMGFKEKIKLYFKIVLKILKLFRRLFFFH